MDVEIGTMASTVRAVDGDSLLAPQTLDKIVRLVLQAVQDEEQHHRRVHAERRVSGGVHAEVDAEER